VEGLRRAGQDLTQTGFITALESIKGFEADMILPTTFGPGDREGNESAKIIEIQPDLTRVLLPVIVTAE